MSVEILGNCNCFISGTPSDTDVYAIVTLEDVSDSANSQPFVVICMDMENQGSNTLILPNARDGFNREMFVVSAPVDPKDAAKRLNAVLET